MEDSLLRGRDLSIRDISTALLQAELERRQDDSERPACGSGKTGSYNTSAHVFALVLILVLSTIACGIPLVSRRATKHSGASRFLFLGQHFGTGVLIATAFVHLLPTAFISLTDPCLPYVWSRGYRPMAGVIAMSSALIVVAIEQFLTTRGAGHSHSHGASWEEEEELTNGDIETHTSTTAPQAYKTKHSGKRHRPSDIALDDLESSQGLVDGASPLPQSTPTRSGKSAHYHDEDNDSDLDLDELDPETAGNSAGLLNGSRSDEPAVPDTPTQLKAQHGTPEQQRRMLLQCLLLEAGILFHSVFIGMAISVATGTAFVVFLIAISFHQSFEGLALGTRIAAINFPKSSPRPWLMVLAYGTTTPIGQAIGLVVHTFYDPQSQTGLLMVGIMNAISSGLLLFAGLVQLLSEDFLTEKSYKVLKGERRWHAYSAVIGGAALMALVGAWA